MKLKVKSSQWYAGLPVVVLKQKTAEAMGVHSKERLLLRKTKKDFREISSILDVSERGIKDDEIELSVEAKKELNVKTGDFLEVKISSPPESLEFIKEKLNKSRLSYEKVKKIIQDVVENNLSEAEIALFISGVYENGMNFKETVSLIKSFLFFGESFSLKNKFVVDKHSIGGIPGNRTTPIVVSICSSAGLIFPKSSSRAITSAAGTADVIETLAKVDFSIEKVKKIIFKTNACLVWGGALEMVPADAKIISIEKELNIDSEALLLASIMSKKLAVGSKYILIDIPFGKKAKVTKAKALHLKKRFEKIGKYFGLKLKAILTDGSQPIGNGIGPVLEMIDVINVLNPSKRGPRDLEEKSLILAGEIFELTKKAKKGKGYLLAKKILKSGRAFEKFKEILKAQEGTFFEPTPSNHFKIFYSSKKGKV